MEISKEVIEAQNLSEEQVTAINGFGKSYGEGLVADAKKEYDGKASADADAILDGAAKSITDLTGVAREQGQKIGDFIGAAWTNFSATKTSELDNAKADYEAKLKDFKGDDATKAALEEARGKYDALQKKTADYDSLKETAGKYDPLLESHNTLKVGQSFASVKPIFDKSVNEYEAKAKWNTFMSEVLDKNTIELVDGEAIAVDKDNPHKTAKLKDLVGSNEIIKALTQGRQQKGIGAEPAKLTTIEGVPFEVPENADGKTIQATIESYLTKKGLSYTSTEFSNEFGKLYNKIREQKTA